MKNSKKGISLIVLVITIIVVIILAAAVIISLQNNNPMTEANKARYSSDVANMQAIFANTVGKAMAHNQDVVSLMIDSETAIENTGIPFTLGVKTDTSTTAGVIKFSTDANGANTGTTNQVWCTGKALPDYKGKGTWKIDPTGNLKLTVGTATYPAD